MFKNRRPRLSGLVVTQWRALYAIVAVLTITGIYLVTTLPEQIYPTMHFSRIIVLAENGDLAPSLVQAGITYPLEQEISTVLGVIQINATSTQGAAYISATFDSKVADINVALQRVSTAVSAVQSKLPAGTNIKVEQVDPSLSPVLGYAIRSTRLNAMALRELAEYQIRPQLLGLPGVSFVTVTGGKVRNYVVSADPVRLAARQLTVDDLTGAIARANVVTSVGHTDNGYVRSTILTMGQAHDAQDIANIPIANRGGSPITVGDVASVVQAPAPPLWSATSGGRNAVLVNVYSQHGASFVGIEHVVSGAIQHVRTEYPQVTITQFWNEATLVSSAIASLRDAILVGLLFSTLVLYFFLRNWASTLVAALVIPLTIILTFAFIGPLRQSLNLMTLGGLAVGVGLIIDDAIVVVENIYRHLGQGEERSDAIERAVSEIAAPMISSTFTTIVVFTPLALLSGITGAFFTALATTLSVALLISLVLALTFTPTVASQFLSSASTHSNRFVSAVRMRYEPLLAWALREPKKVLVGAGIVLVVTVLLGRSLGTDFMPKLDEGSFEIHFFTPPGTTLAETQRIELDIEGIVRSDPAVASEGGTVGANMEYLDTPAGTNEGYIRTTLRPKGARPPTNRVIERIQGRIHEIAPNVQLRIHQPLAELLDDLSNQLAPIQINVFGPTQSTLIPIATDVANRIADIPGVSGLFNGVTYHNPSLVVRPSPVASAFGMNSAQVASCEAAAYDGDVVSSVIQTPLTIPVRVRYPGPLGATLPQVENEPCVTPSGALVPLSRLATFLHAPPQSSITEINQRQYIPVTAQLTGSNLGAVVAAIKQRLATLSLPPGYSTEIAGEYQPQNQSFAQFAFAIGLSVVLVFIVMLVQFCSFTQPIAIALTVPLALFGAFLALFVTHLTLNVSSLMGVILLVGLVVKNGILLLEYTHRAEARGESVPAALASAARVRLRPILMTTLTALLGMLPLAFAIGAGSELLQPLAIAVLGGLSFSTIFTLIVIPVLYHSLMAAWPKRASQVSAEAPVHA
jgi:CzcA family heavy metal efflux pump